MDKICLASDNYAPVHPDVIEAILSCNTGPSVAYGDDPWTKKAIELIQHEFKNECKVLIVPNGTGANVLSLRICCQRYQSVLVSDISHIDHQESGAAEALVGCKLLKVASINGKIYPEAIKKRIEAEKAFGKHSSKPAVLSIAQSTEVGTVYTLAELEAISMLCKQENILLHIDGCRIFNASVYLNASLSEIIQVANPDIVSFGGTKNGLMGVESVLIFNKDLCDGADHLQKQSLQLLSKMRYASAQYIPFFKNKLWKSLAQNANDKAKKIADIIKNTKNMHLTHEVETNQIFFTVPCSWIHLIQEHVTCYLWNKEKNEIRFIASWNTTEEEIISLKTLFSKISRIS